MTCIVGGGAGGAERLPSRAAGGLARRGVPATKAEGATVTEEWQREVPAGAVPDTRGAAAKPMADRADPLAMAAGDPRGTMCSLQSGR